MSIKAFFQLDLTESLPRENGPSTPSSRPTQTTAAPCDVQLAAGSQIRAKNVADASNEFTDWGIENAWG